MLCIPTKSTPAWGMMYVRHCSNSILTPAYLLCNFCNLNKHSYLIWKSLQLFCFVIYKGISTFWLGGFCTCVSHRICTMLVCPWAVRQTGKSVSDNLIFRESCQGYRVISIITFNIWSTTGEAMQYTKTPGYWSCQTLKTHYVLTILTHAAS